MTLAFEAKSVECTDAMAGEILQVCFDTLPEIRDEENRTSPYVLIGRNFELFGPATIEWHDGQDYDGGAEIVSLTLSRDRVLIRLDRELEIRLSFCLANKNFVRLETFLKRIMDARICFTDSEHA